MKKVSLFLFAVAATFALNAQQFYNSDFESWNGNNPLGWNSINFMGQNLCSITKTTDSHSGEAAIEVAPKMIPASVAAMMGIESFAMPGILTNGTIDMIALLELFSNSDTENTEMDPEMIADLLQNALIVEQTPSSVSGFYKFNQAEGSIAAFGAFVVAYGEVNGERTMLGAGMYMNEETATTETYVPFTMQMEYLSEDAQVNELIFIAMIGTEEWETTNFSSVILDDISINYASGLENLELGKQISLYPNPTSGDFTLNAPYGSSISITNTLGQNVKTIDAYNGETISLNQAGIYFVNVDNKAVRKLIVK